MIRMMSQKCFKMSYSRNILVHDPTAFDMLANDIPASGLAQDVSGILKVPYLSKYQGSKEELKQKVKYQGKIIGNLSRLFFSIPTAHKHSQEYYYIHYLLSTSSPHTTLTHQALCCLLGKKTDDPSIHFTNGIKCLIAGKPIAIHLSNPNPREQNPNHSYRNANLLGQNFLRKFKICKLEQNSYEDAAILELIQ